VRLQVLAASASDAQSDVGKQAALENLLCILAVDTQVRWQALKTSVQKWGNSLAVRIPRSVVEEAHLSVGTEVEVGVEEGRIVVARVAPRLRGRALLEELLLRVTECDGREHPR